MSGPFIWINESGSYLGAIGVNSVSEMAQLIVDQGERDYFDALYLEDELPNVQTVERALELMQVHPILLSSGEYRKEQWDNSKVFPCEFDSRPGRGYVKVLGVQL